jgi:hypothetical protein
MMQSPNSQIIQNNPIQSDAGGAFSTLGGNNTLEPRFNETF